MLRVDDGHIDRFRCPFHGFTWNLDGSLAHIPAQWDFPQVVPEEFCLPKAKVGIWGGFVFVNLDPDCAPLTDYLEILPEHFADFPPEDLWKAAHVAKIMPCNWKLVMEAFSESYYIGSAHPETAMMVRTRRPPNPHGSRWNSLGRKLPNSVLPV